MARKKPNRRVEPRFENGSETVMRTNQSDRVGGPPAKPRARKKRKPSLFNRIFIKPLPRLIYWGLVFGLWAFIAVAGIVGYYATQLPSADTWNVPKRPPNMRILADDGSLLGNRGLTGGKALRLEDMSPYIAQAVIAIEDRRFHAHFGFDPIGFSRAMVRNITTGRSREGGSTLTQQLAKNLFLKPDRTLGRKVQELILAFWLEANYSKAEILELYLNRVYFGAGATGVDAASRRYFGKSAKHVSISEAALLAGLLKAPSRYSPARNPKLAQSRAKVVLKAMQREGFVKDGSLNVNEIKPGEHAKHFHSGPEHFVADMIAKDVRELLGKVRGDVVVETTIDPYLMTIAHETLTNALQKHGKQKSVSQAALVSLATDGAVRALIGGKNYGQSQFNRAVDAKRQPGSTFKTFVWQSAIERGHLPQTVVEDEPVRFGRWQPQNYDKKYRGPVTLHQSFAQSLNTIAAKLTMEAGPRNVANIAKRMGIKTPLKANASIALGTSEVSLMELTRSYAPYANGGLGVRPYLVKSIKTSSGNTLYKRRTQELETVLDARDLGMMNAMLTGVVENGTGKTAKLKNHLAGGKTGTSQSFRDALFVGYTAHLVTGVWFGNDDNKPTRKLTGGSLPAQAWRDYMRVAHVDLEPKPLPGEPAYLSSLPAQIPMPKFRPVLHANRTENIGDRLRARVGEVGTKARKSIMDLITGN